MKNNKQWLGICMLGLGVALNACAAPADKPAAAKAAVVQAQGVITEFYEINQDGRLYAFGNAATYKAFLEKGEAAYVLTQIGKGPKKNTLVYVLTKDESKAPEKAPLVRYYRGEIKAASSGFYGETVLGGRYYAFDSEADMHEFRMKGEAPIVNTHIAKGPNRATVVLVRNKNSAKDAAATAALLARFKANHGL